MRLLLDTQALIRAGVSGSAPNLPARSAKALADGKNELFVSVISIVEVNLLVKKKRLAIDRAHIEAGLAKFRVRVLPLSANHVYRLFRLPDHHRDPFDRMIISVALEEDMHLVGGDLQFPKYTGLKVLWD
jgi:PIN domain nuclease of toxin-antitoxin system